MAKAQNAGQVKTLFELSAHVVMDRRNRSELPETLHRYFRGTSMSALELQKCLYSVIHYYREKTTCSPIELWLPYFYRGIIYLDLAHTNATFQPRISPVLQRFTTLSALNVRETQLNDESLSVIADCLPQLEALNLNNCSRITDAGVPALSRLTQLRTLGLRAPAVNISGVRSVSHLPALKCVLLSERVVKFLKELRGVAYCVLRTPGLVLDPSKITTMTSEELKKQLRLHGKRLLDSAEERRRELMKVLAHRSADEALLSKLFGQGQPFVTEFVPPPRPVRVAGATGTEPDIEAEAAAASRCAWINAGGAAGRPAVLASPTSERGVGERGSGVEEERGRQQATSAAAEEEEDAAFSSGGPGMKRKHADARLNTLLAASAGGSETLSSPYRPALAPGTGRGAVAVVESNSLVAVAEAKSAPGGGGGGPTLHTFPAKPGGIEASGAAGSKHAPRGGNKPVYGALEKDGDFDEGGEDDEEEDEDGGGELGGEEEEQGDLDDVARMGNGVKGSKGGSGHRAGEWKRGPTTAVVAAAAASRRRWRESNTGAVGAKGEAKAAPEKQVRGGNGSGSKQQSKRAPPGGGEAIVSLSSEADSGGTGGHDEDYSDDDAPALAASGRGASRGQRGCGAKGRSGGSASSRRGGRGRGPPAGIEPGIRALPFIALDGQPPEPCAFCRRTTEGELEGEFCVVRLGGGGGGGAEKEEKEVFVHENCMEWAPEVWQDEAGLWHGVAQVLKRCARLKCSDCGVGGAALGCSGSRKKSMPRCIPVRTYHYACAKVAACEFVDDEFIIFCVCCRTTACDNADYCAVCHEDGSLVCCDGPCKRAFHLPCLGLDEVPGEEKWYCGTCSRIMTTE